MGRLFKVTAQASSRVGTSLPASRFPPLNAAASRVTCPPTAQAGEGDGSREQGAGEEEEVGSERRKEGEEHRMRGPWLLTTSSLMSPGLTQMGNGRPRMSSALAEPCSQSEAGLRSADPRTLGRGPAPDLMGWE